jgi:hypothetical protein
LFKPPTSSPKDPSPDEQHRSIAKAALRFGSSHIQQKAKLGNSRQLLRVGISPHWRMT